MEGLDNTDDAGGGATSANRELIFQEDDLPKNDDIRMFFVVGRIGAPTLVANDCHIPTGRRRRGAVQCLFIIICVCNYSLSYLIPIASYTQNI